MLFTECYRFTFDKSATKVCLILMPIESSAVSAFHIPLELGFLFEAEEKLKENARFLVLEVVLPMQGSSNKTPKLKLTQA